MTDIAPAPIPEPGETPETAPALVMDGKRYSLDQLSKAARQTIASIRFCDEAIQQRRNELAIADTARIAYLAALKREMAKGSQDTQDELSGASD